MEYEYDECLSNTKKKHKSLSNVLTVERRTQQFTAPICYCEWNAWKKAAVEADSEWQWFCTKKWSLASVKKVIVGVSWTQKELCWLLAHGRVEE